MDSAILTILQVCAPYHLFFCRSSCVEEQRCNSVFLTVDIRRPSLPPSKSANEQRSAMDDHKSFILSDAAFQVNVGGYM